MKKILYIFVIIVFMLSLLTVSCGENGDNNGDTNNDITISDTTTINLAVTLVNNYIKLNWTYTDTENIDTFQIYKSINMNNFSNILNIDSNVTTYSDTPILGENTYYYVIQSIDENSLPMSQSNIDSIVVNCTESITLNFIYYSDTNTIELFWTNANTESISSYSIYKKIDDDTFSRLANIDYNITSYSDTLIYSDSNVFYYIVGYNTNLTDISHSNIVNYSNISINLTANYTDSGVVSLLWINSSTEPIDTYKIYKKINNGSFNYYRPTDSSTFNYIDNYISTDNTYYYLIRSFSSNTYISKSNIDSVALSPSLILTPNTTNVALNDTFTFSVSYKLFPLFIGISIGLVYDTDILEYVSNTTQDSSDISGNSMGIFLLTNNDTVGKITIGDSRRDSKPLTFGDGHIVTITMKRISTASDSEAIILYNPRYQDYNNTTQNIYSYNKISL